MKKVYVVKTESGSEYLFAEEGDKIFVHGRKVKQHAHIPSFAHLADAWTPLVNVHPWPPAPKAHIYMSYYSSKKEYLYRNTSEVVEVTAGFFEDKP